MTAWQVAWFAGALAVAAAVPGPAVMATIGRVLGRGERGEVGFGLGLLLGDLLWLWIAALGLGAAARAFGVALRWGELVGAGYLLVLAWRMARSEPMALDAALATHDGRAWRSGFVLQLGNPKAVLFYAALMPAIVPRWADRGAPRDAVDRRRDRAVEGADVVAGLGHCHAPVMGECAQRSVTA